MPASGVASYKKKDGQIFLKEHNVEWTEKGSMQPGLTIALSAIKNLQASPATAASASMRIFAAASMSAEPVAHTFKFTQASGARQEMDAFVTALQGAITAKKTANQKAPAKPTVSEILASKDVESDPDLQESLLKSNPELANTFREAVINGSVTPAQFWSSRGHLLRAFLVERSQQKGPYNVLATIRPKTVDNKITVNMTRDKIRDVFVQHPILRRIYDETVPPLGEDEFWSRFFVSRLCKKLRGERILPSDPIDDKLDKFINIEADESRKRAREEAEGHVPNVIDLEGNENQNSKKMGNAPDFTMRPSKTDVINSINAISLRMLDSLNAAAGTTQDESNGHADPGQANGKAEGGQGFEDRYYENEIQLGDLTAPPSDSRVPLTINDQSSLYPPSSSNSNSHSHSHSTAAGAAAADPLATTPRPLPPSAILSSIKCAIPPNFQITTTSDSQLTDTATSLLPLLSSHAATRHHPVQADTLHQITMSHSVTIEFLSLFWKLWKSGDEGQSKALGKIVDALSRTEARVNAIRERVERVERVESVGGGEEREGGRDLGKRRKREEGKMVEVVTRPMMRAVERAMGEYRRAVEEATAAAAAAATASATATAGSSAARSIGAT